MSKKKIVIMALLNTVIVTIMVGAVIAANIFSPILTSFFGVLGGNKLGNAEYSDYQSKDELDQARKNISYDIMAEGAVLLRNENKVLPLGKNSKVSVFGQHAHEILASGSGSGSNGGPKSTIKDVLETAGFSVNEVLWDFYLKNGIKSLGNGPALIGGNSVTDWSINEAPQSIYTVDVKESYKDFNDAAIVVISRTGGEGGDLATDMSLYGGNADEHYLEISDEEAEMLSEVTASFEKTIVILNTNNPIEMGFLEDYGIDACLYIGGVGMSGLDAVGDILCGTVNPSGRIGDTYLYDNFSAPAVQNFGAYDYINAPQYHYVVYSEGIYVGYRYYETRYADKIMQAEKAGDFEYGDVVAYPFGYGLSYTTFEWSNFSVNYDEETDTFVAEITVTNTGDSAGKDVVEIYYQSPYIHGQTKIEKAAVELADFSKTKELSPGESQVLSFRIEKRSLASYDDQIADTYVLEKGDYYFTAAGNAHEAVDNILAKQGFETESTMLVSKYTQNVTDSTSYSVDKYTGNKISNLFDYARFDGMTVLSRDNWQMVEEGLGNDKLTISREDLLQAEKSGREASRNPDVKYDKKIITGTEDKLRLQDLIGAEWTDQRWDTLISEIGKADLRSLFATAGYTTIDIEKIGKPKTTDLDGPGGIQSFVGGASSVDAYGYPSETLMACTWNTDILHDYGRMIGEDALATNTNGWYAPGMNGHRTPFGGRNFEYYSEDGMLSGAMGASVVKGAREKGLYCYIKHFALNEQDTNRGTTLHTWAPEQAMREIYFKPFQMSVQEGKSSAVMTSLTCIGNTGAMGNYQLITNLLKEEWGFKGLVITDYLGYDASLLEQVLFAGGDAMLSTYGMFNDTDDAVIHQLQRAAKSCLYTVANSNAMYGLEADEKTRTVPIYRIMLIIMEAILLSSLIIIDYIFLIKKRTKQ